MRISKSLGIPLAATFFVVLLVPTPGLAGTGPTTKNCPTEPTQNVPIVSGETYYGTNCVLSTTGDADEFVFSASAGSTFKMLAGLGASPATNVCLTLYAPGVPATTVFSGCSSINYPNYANSVGTTQTLTKAGQYTIKVSEASNAVITYGVTLERLNPTPPEAIPLILSKNVSSQITPITAQDSYSFGGNTAGEYQITASVTSGATSNICFDIFQPDGTIVVSASCTSINYPNYRNSTTADLTPAVSGTYIVLVYVAGNDGVQGYNLEVTCLLGNCNPANCVLKDTVTYASGTLTMDFTIGTPYAVTWNAWLVSGNLMQSLWSQPQAITEPQITVTKTQALGASGRVGVLSTFTTAKKGITCSSWQQVNTGTP